MGSLRLVVAVAAARASTVPTVVMYETRRLDGDTYWRASYELAAAYASRHGHNFVLYTVPAAARDTMFTSIAERLRRFEGLGR